MGMKHISLVTLSTCFISIRGPFFVKDADCDDHRVAKWEDPLVLEVLFLILDSHSSLLCNIETLESL